MSTKTARTPDERAIAKNGSAYNLYYDSKTAKKVDELILDGFIENDTADPLTANVEKNNTKILFSFIKEKFPDAVLKYGKINVADYRIYYASHGFQISDLRNYGEAININDYHNDFPTPETVLKFITETIKRPFTQKPVKKQEVQVGEIMKLASLGKVIIKDVKTLKVEKIKPQKMKDRLHAETENIFSRFKSGLISYRETLQKLKSRLPEKIQKECVDLLKQYRSGTVTWRRLIILLGKDIVLPYLEFKKTEKPVRQPKFEAPVLWEPINPVVRIAAHVVTMQRNDEGIVYGRDSVVPVLKNNYRPDESDLVIEPDLLWMKFETRGPSGKKYEVVCTLEEYLANVVLHNYPKAMPLLMKVAIGEITEMPDVFNMSLSRFIVDPFQKYEPDSLRHPVDRFLFCKVCRNILSVEGIETMFERVYDNNIALGTKVSVWSPMTCITDEGKVISTETGITIRFTFGTVATLKVGEVLNLTE